MRTMPCFCVCSASLVGRQRGRCSAEGPQPRHWHGRGPRPLQRHAQGGREQVNYL